MEDEDVKVTVVKFEEELYLKNIKENDFSNKEKDGIGDKHGDN